MGELVIAIDFDGTLVRHEYPDIGLECPGASETVRWLQSLGVKVILYTMRSGVELDAALRWMTERGIPPWAVNTNPAQLTWTTSPKAYAHLYIDDAALGAPLISPPYGRPYVCWTQVRKMLEERFSGMPGN